MKVRVEILNELRERMEGEMVPAVRTGMVLCVSWNFTVAMLCKEVVLDVVVIVKLSSKDESEDKEVMDEGGGMTLSSMFVGGGGVWWFT